LNKSGLIIFFLMSNVLYAGAQASSITLSGNGSYESRFFLKEGFSGTSYLLTNSTSFSPELYMSWENEKHTFLVSPFLRIDQEDPDRTHFDLREFTYSYNKYDWELRLGVRKIFWGVAESNHLVDVINQSDSIENIDLEDKLGQPMINLAFIRDWGSVDFFVLPLFRERTFAGTEGRPKVSSLLRGKEGDFESGAKRNHVDYAVRFSTYTDNMDIGLYHFWGTTRAPRLVPDNRVNGAVVFVPFYEIIHQTGLDMQLTMGNTLYKLEMLRYSSDFETYLATVGGGEYTFTGIADTNIDLGILGEYHWDERGERSPSFFNNDLFGGMRIAANDVHDSQLLAGFIKDLNNHSLMFNIEASRRLSNHWKIEIEMRLFVDLASNDPSFGLQDEDYIQLEIFRYF